MSWTLQELAILKARAAEGLSAGKIADCLPGKSRNAVIGMLRRGDGLYGALQGRPKNEARGRVAMSKADNTAAKLKPRPKRDFKGDRAAAKVVPVEPAPPLVDPVANLPAPLPITFLDAVMKKRCLHYVGDWLSPDGPGMPVCGAERAQNVIETRYCRRHLLAQRQAVAA